MNIPCARTRPLEWRRLWWEGDSNGEWSTDVTTGVEICEQRERVLSDLWSAPFPSEGGEEEEINGYFEDWRTLEWEGGLETPEGISLGAESMLGLSCIHATSPKFQFPDDGIPVVNVFSPLFPNFPKLDPQMFVAWALVALGPGPSESQPDRPSALSPQPCELFPRFWSKV